MRVHLGAHLSWYAPGRQSTLDIALAVPTPLRQVAEGLNLPLGEIALAVVNGERVAIETACVTDADRVVLHPPIGAG